MANATLYLFQPRYFPAQLMSVADISRLLDRDEVTVVKALRDADGAALRACDLPPMRDSEGGFLSSPERTRELAHMATYLPVSRWGELHSRRYMDVTRHEQRAS